MPKTLSLKVALLLSFSLFICPLAGLAQSKPLTCADVRNGTFNYYSANDFSSIYIRNGETQREITKKRKETIFWEVTWINDCTYSLKYISGGEQRVKADQDIFRKHKIICEILSVTEDYYVVRTALDKVSNKTVLQDTLWIKERKGLTGKSVTNPRADSIALSRVSAADTSTAKKAAIFIYRPAKFMNALATYDIYFNDVAVATITNGVRLKIEVPEGSIKISAKETIRNTVITLTLDAKSGKQYYLKCEALHKLSYTLPRLTLMELAEGRAEFGSN
ncbi:MAG: DUF2846 domain-containing protein [Chitinophagaceae bacterium]